MLCLAGLFSAQAAFALTPPPVTTIYPIRHEQGLPSNTVVTVHTNYGYQLDPAKVVLLMGPMDNEVPVTLTPEVDAKGSIEVKPSAALAPGPYTLKTGFEQHSVYVSRGADTEPPSAILEPSVITTRGGKDSLGDIALEFAAPTDNDTPIGEIGYDVWLSKAPKEPDLEGKPSLMGTTGNLLENGKTHVSLAPGALCVHAFPKDASGRFIVRLRARDMAGNLGPASPPIEVKVDEVPKCRSFMEISEEDGCTTVPMLAPAAWVAVALWLRRRRR